MPATRTSKSSTQLTLTGEPVKQPAVSKSKSKSKTKQERVETDVIISIKPEFAHLISTREKNHEYRKYKLKDSVERMWFYETAPTSAIRYVASIGHAKVPGEVKDSSGVGNDDFDAGKKLSKYGYPVSGLCRLKTHITSTQMKQSYGMSPPQAFIYATPKLLEDHPLTDQETVF
ncbi:hypothetical protein JAAARDRAFT_71603 [Jaapia argillacea MUCL 33604]|uniref:ASCH domain-containing protein n=1 Tax=Jaapia argillacea MUCL 33604 TaxID=933084 RepID=A0A067PJ00_9AGAM|nr:hypothetical protein JAAARDRAFT_71603 [Jaapia argillacea MUCL 33604]